MSPISEARRRANQKYNAKAYEEIKIRVPMGQKATLQAAAAKKHQSINAFVTAAILARMKLKQWPDLTIVVQDDSPDKPLIARGDLVDGGSWEVR